MARITKQNVYNAAKHLSNISQQDFRVEHDTVYGWALYLVRGNSETRIGYRTQKTADMYATIHAIMDYHRAMGE